MKAQLSKARETWKVGKVGKKNPEEKLISFFPPHLLRTNLNSSSLKTCKFSPKQKSQLLLDIGSTHLTIKSQIEKSPYHGVWKLRIESHAKLVLCHFTQEPQFSHLEMGTR